MRYRFRCAALASAMTVGLFVLSACSDDRKPPPSVTPSAEPATGTAMARESPTATPSPTVVTPTPAPPPPDAYRDAPPSGRADVDEVIRAVRGGDPLALLASFRTKEQPCGSEEFITRPACAAGQAPGTLVPSVFAFQCDAAWVPLAVLRGHPSGLILTDYFFYSATIGGPSSSLIRSPAGEAVESRIVFETSHPNLPKWLAGGAATDVTRAR